MEPQVANPRQDEQFRRDALARAAAGTRQPIPEPESLPLGPWGAADLATAQRLCAILHRHGQTMHQNDYDTIISRLRAGYHCRTGGSVLDPHHHHIYIRLYDENVDSVSMTELTYVNWVFLAATYGPNHGRLRKFQRRLLFKFGWDLTADLAYQADVDAVNQFRYAALVRMRQARRRATRDNYGELGW
ncbi:hypothetical protein NW759_003695 [Fusarium solani]|nr:hypothetical protein NW759_003695 [Fusarium solani]